MLDFTNNYGILLIVEAYEFCCGNCIRMTALNIITKRTEPRDFIDIVTEEFYGSKTKKPDEKTRFQTNCI
jgi:hypothetical protein